jgi:pSer/pThr/pTyr-binding forkhead associated (FHA) protein
MPFLSIGDDTRELRTGETLVGSGTQATWRLSNADLAARHFSVVVPGNGAASGSRPMLKPSSPQGIVVVNGRQVGSSGVELEHGDVIGAGSARFIYVEERGRALPASTAAATADLPAFLVNEEERVAYPLSKKTVSIGRDIASHILVRDPSVSRFHADVRAEAGHFVLYAMGSSGTRVNGHNVSGPQLLEEGDRIQVGDQTFRFTREPLGGGVTPVPLGGASEEDDKLSRRATQYSSRAVTGSGRTVPGPESSRPLLPIIVVIAVAIAVAAFLLLR